MELDEDAVIAAQRVGTQLAGWTLTRLLGIGGMASVFLGKRGDGAVAAVKVLHPYLTNIDELRKRFLREGPIGSALAAMAPLCEGLPQVFESGIAPAGEAYMAMEVLDGESYFERAVRQGPLPAEEVLWVAHKALDVLVVAHAYGIVHRDLKPENLFLTRDGRLKLLDFGIARVLEELPTGALPEKTMTRTGTKIGSVEYMAPEQALGRVKEIDGRTDVFGLGSTLFRLLAGRTVHGDVFDANLLIAAATQEAPPLSVVAPFVAPAVCAVVDRALAFKREHRYPDAATMRFDVFALRQGRPPPYVLAVAEGKVQPGERLAAQ